MVTAPTTWHEHGVAAEGWTADGLPTRVAALEGTGPPVAGEERLYDALGRAVAVRTTTPTGGASTVFHAWWGDTILSEEWAEGWRRDGYPGLGLDAPLGYRLDCSAGNCGLPPLGLGVGGAGLDANEPAAVFWTIQEQPSTGPGGAGAQGGSSDLPKARRGPRRRRHRRRDGLGVGNHESDRRHTFNDSLVLTCRNVDVNPTEYLTWLLKVIDDTSSQRVQRVRRPLALRGIVDCATE